LALRCHYYKVGRSSAIDSSSLEALKQTLAILVSGVALLGAVFLAVVHLKTHGHYHCDPIPGLPGRCFARTSYWVVGRYAWQIPVAVAVGLAGLGATLALTRGARPSA
jgi:hypothetical protein